MYRQVRTLLSFHNKTQITYRNFNSSYIDVKDEVRFALETGKPVVALESTIITHGMPFPENVNCASDVENIVRLQGVIPATVAIINGRIKVGLSRDELKYLGNIQSSKPIKTSRRDFPYVISNRLNGGTTVCGTLIVANDVCIPVFATGGIGGVHRGAHKSFDISGDLIELGRCSIAVVSSGVKSILDIPKTLEYLETQGVFVATFGDNKEFPAFYSRMSGSKAPYCVKNAKQAAEIIKCNRDMNMRSGMLFGVPVPEEYALLPEIIDNAVEETLRRNKQHMQVIGKDVTPYVLSQLAKVTGGKTLQSNIALIKNNAQVAAKIAVELAYLEQEDKDRIHIVDPTVIKKEELKGRPVVIGGSNLDCSAHLTSSEIKAEAGGDGVPGEAMKAAIRVPDVGAEGPMDDDAAMEHPRDQSIVGPPTESMSTHDRIVKAMSLATRVPYRGAEGPVSDDSAMQYPRAVAVFPRSPNRLMMGLLRSHHLPRAPMMMAPTWMEEPG